MCGIAGIISSKNQVHSRLLETMSDLISHRGPDDQGVWLNNDASVGLAHRRLSIIDLSDDGHQPMHAIGKLSIVFNGEIYNYKELRKSLQHSWSFKTRTDTEVILAAYSVHGEKCVNLFRGMFAFAIWNDTEKLLFCARDHFGIKPFYYTINNGGICFASEAKALLPCLSNFSLNKKAIFEYLNFQFALESDTLIDAIKQLPPAHSLTFKPEINKIHIEKYWNLNYDIDESSRSADEIQEEFKYLLNDSISIHLNSDVPVGSYLSGGVDSNIVSVLATKQQSNVDVVHAFHGKFSEFPECDESYFAQKSASFSGQRLNTIDITSQDFLDNINKINYHLDFPVAGPGSFPQYMVSGLVANKNVKVVLGGQGGDELFGGYARYMVGYLEQCIKANIMGNEQNLEIPFTSILPNLTLLKQYTPLIQSSWSNGLFEDFASRYFRLINRSNDFTNEIHWNYFKEEQTILPNSFNTIFNDPSVANAGFINKMLHFDFKTLLPALLQVEDRVSMAHGIESRVPFLDYRIAEFAAQIPPSIKFADGKMKHIIKSSFSDEIPKEIHMRKDKMGFPVPLASWFQNNDCKSFLMDTFNTGKNKHREYINYDSILSSINSKQGSFSRKIWGLLSLELWHQNFQDNFKPFT
jgi:asparagine synthase (glutamine-hydrolysing)